MPSSVIRAFSYDAASRKLTIAFVSARLYVYDDVPPEVAEDFRHASSKGGFFNAIIRDRYAFREVTRRAA